MTMIGGTTFPWYGRTGNGPITLTGLVNLHQQGPPLNISNVTVTVNGLPCTLTPVPYNPTLEARWSYNGPQFAAPVGPCQWNLNFAAFYNGQLMVDYGLLTSDTFAINVYRVSSPAQAAADIVNIGPMGNCVYDPESFRLAGSNYPTTRQLTVTATIIPPPGQPGVCTITLGVIQTLTLQVDVSFGQIPALQLPCSLHFPTPATPIWDGDPNGPPCYYDAGCVWTTPAAPWSLPCNSKELDLDDWPNFSFNGLAAKILGQNYSVVWDMLAGIGNECLYTAVFEDMISASTSEWPGVVVPIYGYTVWQVSLSGAWSNALGTWWGPGVVIVSPTTSNPPVTDPTKGPANSFAQPWVTVP